VPLLKKAGLRGEEKAGDLQASEKPQSDLYRLLVYYLEETLLPLEEAREAL